MFLRIYLPPPPEFEIYRDLSEFIWIFVYLPSYIIKYLGPKFFTLWRKRKKRRNTSTRRLRPMTHTSPMRTIIQNNTHRELSLKMCVNYMHQIDLYVFTRRIFNLVRVLIAIDKNHQNWGIVKSLKLSCRPQVAHISKVQLPYMVK